MGVSIHYRGRLNDVGQLGALCEELTDIANAMGWQSTTLDDDWGQPADARLRHTDTGVHIDGNLGLRGIQIEMDFINTKIEQLSTGLSSRCLGDTSGLSAEQIAEKIEQWFLDRDAEQKGQ